MIGKAIASALVGGALLLGAAAPSQAWDKGCEQRVRKAEQNLQKAERKHGRDSKQTRQRREQLERARANCKVDRDQRNHDHDHDHDHR